MTTMRTRLREGQIDLLNAMGIVLLILAIIFGAYAFDRLGDLRHDTSSVGYAGYFNAHAQKLIDERIKASKADPAKAASASQLTNKELDLLLRAAAADNGDGAIDVNRQQVEMNMEMARLGLFELALLVSGAFLLVAHRPHSYSQETDQITR